MIVLNLKIGSDTTTQYIYNDYKLSNWPHFYQLLLNKGQKSRMDESSWFRALKMLRWNKKSKLSGRRCEVPQTDGLWKYWYHFFFLFILSAASIILCGSDDFVTDFENEYIERLELCEERSFVKCRKSLHETLIQKSALHMEEKKSSDYESARRSWNVRNCTF